MAFFEEQMVERNVDSTSIKISLLSFDKVEKENEIKDSETKFTPEIHLEIVDISFHYDGFQFVQRNGSGEV